MAVYSIANRTTATGAAAACLEMFASSAVSPRLLELGISLNAATASAFGVGRPAAVGITPTSPKRLLAENQSDPVSATQTALAWGTGPTVPADFFRRVSLPATVGAGVVWTFPKGVIISVSSSIVLWNITTVSAADVWVVSDE